MDKLAKLTTDIGKLWETYSGAYFTGIRNTLVLAVVATLIGCVIGLLCGILNTIPYTRQDPPAKGFNRVSRIRIKSLLDAKPCGT